MPEQLTGNSPAVWNSELNDPGYTPPAGSEPLGSKPPTAPKDPIKVWGGDPVRRPIADPIRITEPIRIAPKMPVRSPIADPIARSPFNYGASYSARKPSFAEMETE